MPDVFFSSQEEIPEGLREEAAKDEASGKFKVNLVLNSKLVEFRDNNIALRNQNDSMSQKMSALNEIVGDDVDAFKSKYSELIATDQRVKDGQLKGNDAIQREVESRVNSVKEGFQTQLRDAGAKLQQANERGDKFEGLFKTSIRDREITSAVLSKDSGANPEALPDIQSRAARLFTVTDDGKLVPKDGDTIIYGADGATPMSPKEWLGKLLEEAPYLGKSSTGGGAAGDRGKAKYGGLSEDEFNKLEPQRRMELARGVKQQ